MTPGIVHIDPRADADIDEHFLYIAGDKLDPAIRFLEAVDAALRQLASMPGMGAARNFASPRLRGVRSWPITGFENYLIFYRPMDDGIQVVRVLHGAVDIPGRL